jgi:hypothetical protein
VTYRSTGKGKSIFSRAAAWLVAYAFVLQTVLAPIAAAAASRTAQADPAAVVLCAEHAEALDQTEKQPIAPHDHEAICKFCIGCPSNALLAPDTFAGASVHFAITAVRWHAVFAADSNRSFLAGKQARGPPTLT